MPVCTSSHGLPLPLSASEVVAAAALVVSVRVRCLCASALSLCECVRRLLCDLTCLVVFVFAVAHPARLLLAPGFRSPCVSLLPASAL
eukprot:359646-Chlamydomonas_euryale.AAC.4